MRKEDDDDVNKRMNHKKCDPFNPIIAVYAVFFSCVMCVCITCEGELNKIWKWKYGR